jgi:hypothetical protein
MKDMDDTRAAVEACARDYAEGWYAGDAARMRRALHPDLVKRTMVADPHRTGAITTDRVSTAERMVRLTAEGEGTEGAGDPDVRIEIAHLYRGMAMVACRTRDFMDYLHLADCGRDGWRIVHALWLPHEGLFDRAGAAEADGAFWRPDG